MTVIIILKVNESAYLLSSYPFCIITDNETFYSLFRFTFATFIIFYIKCSQVFLEIFEFFAIVF